MPPAPLPRMSATETLGTTEPSAWQGDALIPVMQPASGAPDPVALATWHLALDSSTAIEVPHELFALWVYPVFGGAVLLGPPELAQDHVVVPVPSPRLSQDDLYQLEEILRRARYASVMAVPVRHQTRDVGVMLLGSFARGAFGPSQAMALQRLAQRLEPELAQLAESLPAVAPHAALEPQMTREALPEHLARAACEAVSGPDLVRRVSGILYPLLPHDRLEILVLGVAEESFIALSGSPPRRRWSVGAHPDTPGDIVARFDGEATLLLTDLTELGSQGEWPAGTGPGPVLPARSILGARLTVGGLTVGYLLLASVAEDTYRPDDEDTLSLAGLILAPRVAAIRTGEPIPSSVPTGGEAPLLRAATVLATTAHLGEALAGFASELGQLVPHQGLTIHLRRGEQEVIALDPQAPRPLSDLPAIPLDEFAGAAILRGEREWLVRTIDEGDEVLVPLRVAGRPVGTLGIRSTQLDSARGAAAIALPFADALAPHLELLRRGATMGPTARPQRVLSSD